MKAMIGKFVLVENEEDPGFCRKGFSSVIVFR
jgi:hypothetical protein